MIATSISPELLGDLSRCCEHRFSVGDVDSDREGGTSQLCGKRVELVGASRADRHPVATGGIGAGQLCPDAG